MIVQDEILLRQSCEEVKLDEVKDLIAQLEEELKYLASINRAGVGLAAPQINIHKKIAIVRLENFSLNLVNAEIKHCYDPFTFKGEGCLSFPDKILDTLRYNEVHITNNLVEPYGFIATGFTAVVVQHEIDHYSGKLFMDRQIEIPQIKVKMRPNDKCSCSSGKKFKHCCGKSKENQNA